MQEYIYENDLQIEIVTHGRCSLSWRKQQEFLEQAILFSQID